LRPGFSVFDPAALIALAGAALFALYQVLTRMAAEDPAEVSLLYTGLVGFVVLTFFGPFFWVWPTITETGLLAAAGLLGVVAHLALIKALSLAPASTLQPFNYTLIVWATLIGFLIFDTFPDSWTLVGAGIIVCSGLYALARERRAKT
ncbi:MAG: DMT family transporter, partial [Rhodospirillaceae bacterium]|nr:DMT family transporter [Rhodospirillaceae bacterium]